MKKTVVTWTPEQSAAISLKDRTLLVSAAAGSGKTAVLTERIIKKLTDKENPSDISRFLIVTFTKAAASELKSRISKAITEAISEDPANKHLSRQLLLLNSAKISTIHSFCLDVIKKNLQALDLPRGLSVANDTEMLLYSREIMNEIKDETNSIFTPVAEIYLIISEKNRYVKIKDTGVGMTLDIIKKHFLNVGKSYYKSREYLFKDYGSIINVGVSNK